MNSKQLFPEDPKEFIQGYAFKDTFGPYTDGYDLVPLFRVNQLIDHYIINSDNSDNTKQVAERYNTAVRNQISEEYVMASKDRKYARECMSDLIDKISDKANITVAEYEGAQERIEMYHRMIHDLNVVIDTWDKAREICLSAADDMFKGCKSSDKLPKLKGADN